MKLTEKELNEFPIGTKIHCKNGNEYLKSDYSETGWREIKGYFWITNETVLTAKIQKVEIPTYTEYIPAKPILDEKEKEYLSTVIKPWRDEVIYIKKKGVKQDDGKKEEWLYIDVNNDYARLPFFKAGTMYKGMELDKEYTLEELGL